MPLCNRRILISACSNLLKDVNSLVATCAFLAVCIRITFLNTQLLCVCNSYTLVPLISLLWKARTACSKTLTTGTTEQRRNNGYFDKGFSENECYPRSLQNPYQSVRCSGSAPLFRLSVFYYMPARTVLNDFVCRLSKICVFWAPRGSGLLPSGFYIHINLSFSVFNSNLFHLS